VNSFEKLSVKKSYDATHTVLGKQSLLGPNL
jgi:hypothetical protein